MKSVAIDMDGVLVDFNSTYRQYKRELFPENPNAGDMPVDYDGSNCNISKKDMNKVWDRIHKTENFWLNLLPINSSLWALKTYLRNNPDAEICFLTSRVNSAGWGVSAQTEAWLRKYGIKGENLSVAVCKASDKAKYIFTNGIEYFVDDKIETVRDVISQQNDHLTYLYKQPWNVSAWDDLPTVSSLSNFLKNVRSWKHMDAIPCYN